MEILIQSPLQLMKKVLDMSVESATTLQRLNLVRRIVTILTVMIVTTGCGPLVKIETDDPRSGSGIDPRVTDYVEEFEFYYGREIYNVPISFKHQLRDKKIGLCKQYFRPKVREIILEEKTWQRLNDTQKLVLVFHELGHCVLDLPHVTDKVDGKPLSIMYPSVSPVARAWGTNEERYIEELFND